MRILAQPSSGFIGAQDFSVGFEWNCAQVMLAAVRGNDSRAWLNDALKKARTHAHTRIHAHLNAGTCEHMIVYKHV